MTLSHKLFSYAGLRLRKAYQCSSGCCQATDKTILCTSLNHFISKVVDDKFPFVCVVVANGTCLRIGCLSNLLLTVTIVLLPQILSAKLSYLSPVLYRT